MALGIALVITWNVTALTTSLQSVNLLALVTYSNGGDATRADRLSVSTSCRNVPVETDKTVMLAKS